MTRDIFIFSIIHLLVPLAGVILYARLCFKMIDKCIPHPPLISYLVLFGIFGGWLVAFLTGLFWYWSGMASLGIFFLLLIAPLLTGAIAFSLRNLGTLSAYHRWALFMSVGYSGIALCLWMILILRMVTKS